MKIRPLPAGTIRAILLFPFQVAAVIAAYAAPIFLAIGFGLG